MSSSQEAGSEEGQNAIVVWEDLSKQLVNMVLSILQNQPEVVNEKTVHAMIEPYLAQIEKDVELRIRQADEDAKAAMVKKGNDSYAEQKRYEFMRNLKVSRTVKFGNAASRVFSYSEHWSHHLPALSKLMPEYANVTVTLEPPLIATETVPDGWESYHRWDDKKYEAYRSTIRITGFSDRINLLLAACEGWSAAVGTLSNFGVRLSAEQFTEALALGNSEATLTAMEAITKLASQRYITRKQFIEFFTRAGSYEWANIRCIKDAMENTTLANLAGSHRLSLLDENYPPRRRPDERKKQEQELV